MQENDKIRQRMLAYFYDRNANATSERGKKGSHVKISDVKADLKRLSGYSQQQVVSNLNYLVGSGWVSRTEEHRTFRAAGGTQQPSTAVWYSISAMGVDLMEGGSSQYKRRDPFAGINITAVSSTVQVGDGNYANVQYSQVPGMLDDLAKQLSQSADLDDASKVAAVADIETVKAQLIKPDPNSGIVQAAWVTIERAAALAGLANVAESVAGRLTGLL